LYWDFCNKYEYDPCGTESLSWFLHKLVEKRQSEQQQTQARHTFTMFYRMQYKLASFSATELPVNSFQTAVRDQTTPLTVFPDWTMATWYTLSKPANQGSS
jgi:hypothetical protein